MRPVDGGPARSALLRGASVLLSAALLLLIALIAAPGETRANGVPMRIPLSYLAGLSNWGPADATGEAELSYSEGLVNLTARGLGGTGDGRYALWLVRTATNSAVSLGEFAPQADGTASYSGKLPSITSYEYDLIILTVRDAGDPASLPGAKRAIGGYFTPVKAPDAAVPGIAADTQPAILPQTGEQPAAAGAGGRILGFSHHQAALALFGLGGVLLAATVLRRRGLRA